MRLSLCRGPLSVRGGPPWGAPQGGPQLRNLCSSGGGSRCFSSYLLSCLSPQELLLLAQELQQRHLYAAQQTLSAAAFAAAVRRAQKAAAPLGAPVGPPPLGAPKGAPLHLQQVSLEEVWGQLLFLLHGALHQLQPEALCCLLRLLAAGGPCSQQQGAPSFGHPLGRGPTGEEGASVGEETQLYASAAAAAATAGAAGAAADAAAHAAATAGEGTPRETHKGPLFISAGEQQIRIKEGALVGGPYSISSLLQSLEVLLLLHAEELSLLSAAATVNCPQLLLSPFVKLPQKLLQRRPVDAAAVAAAGAGEPGTGSSSSSSSSCLLLELLLPLGGPLKDLLFASSAEGQSETRRALKRILTAAPAAAAGAAAAAAGGPSSESPLEGALIEVWHAALSLELHSPLLAAAALQLAAETFYLLPTNSKGPPIAAAAAAAATITQRSCLLRLLFFLLLLSLFLSPLLSMLLSLFGLSLLPHFLSLLQQQQQQQQQQQHQQQL
ncbi:hypothetical protein EAH_00021340 [Eimeria acervulina]|uniref:Uncharacterized protein n=1 Tax=Eimeria acervulina TaxID=5801 RepID=U6GES9_EIMAC|nr:hypothetical protein EAH_00021340 [Eimeria acervulina]CDI77054.1 hypothetical protein EAH_00021340 [Eimeria acervulina]